MLSLGIPNGSLFEPTIELLSRVGVKIKLNGRNFIVDLPNGVVFKKAIIMRPQDIPEAVFDGMLGAGICGRDCVFEAGLDNKLFEVAEFNYSKKSRAPVRVVIFGRAGDEIIDKDNILVTSEYPNLTKPFFKKARIRFSHGSTEQKVVYGKYRYGVGVTETGDSLRDNGLAILKTILVSPTVLVAKNKTPEIEIFGKMLSGGLASEKYQLIKMNVSQEIKPAVLKNLPALRSPTIGSLIDGSFALETIIKKELSAKVIFKLLELGATDIIAQDVNIVL